MTVEEAWKFSTARIAVRDLGGPDPRLCAEPWEPSHGESKLDHTSRVNYVYRRTNAKVMPLCYANFHDDWIPWDPKDPITMLGDLVRQVGRVELVA